MRKAFLLVLISLIRSHAGDDISISPYIVLSSPAIDFESKSRFGNVSYDANNAPAPGVDLRYKNYEFGISPPLFGRTSDDSHFSPTRFFDLKASYYADNWAFSGFYQDFKSFYSLVNDSLSYNTPSMSLTSMNVNIYRSYKPDKVGLLDEILEHNGLQGNLYYLVALAHQNLNVGVSPLGYVDTKDSSQLDELRRLQTTELSGAIGVSLNTYLFGFYFNTSDFVGFGSQYRSTNIPIAPFGYTIKIILKGELGFQVRHFGVGLMVSDDASSVEMESESVLFHSVIVKTLANVTF